MQIELCCQRIEGDKAASSPFDKCITIGWYDGATSGVIRCGQCSTAYRFEMIDYDYNGDVDKHAWLMARQIRIFSLAQLPASTFEQLIAALSVEKQPQWPDWVPDWTFTSELSKKVVEDQVERILAMASYPGLVVASHNLLEDIVAAKKINVEELSTDRNWFSFLGLA